MNLYKGCWLESLYLRKFLLSRYFKFYWFEDFTNTLLLSNFSICHLVQFNRDLWKELSIRQLWNNAVSEKFLNSCYRIRTNSVRQKFSKMAFTVSYCHKELLIRCCRHSGSASGGSTWHKVILIWRKQPSKLIQ